MNMLMKENIEKRLEEDTWRTLVDQRLNAGALATQTLQTGLDANTAATEKIQQTVSEVQANTSELVYLLNSFKGAFYVLDKLGKLAKPIGYIVAVVTGIIALISAVKSGGVTK